MLHWTLGAPQETGELAVAPGSVFQVRFSAIVTSAAPGSVPNASTNYAKLQSQNSDGTISALRDRAAFDVDPAPPVSILKGVYSVDGLPAGGNPPNVDHVQVQEGDVVVFRVDVTNPPRPPARSSQCKPGMSSPPASLRRRQRHHRRRGVHQPRDPINLPSPTRPPSAPSCGTGRPAR